ncbi:hypothetical protein JTB14_011430 [Gonioctena quinquepunctata]|nr:hypothetical protein JTB14_011430 [Gonioctena quinquepunctata]
MDLNPREDFSQVVEGVTDFNYHLGSAFCNLDGLDVETSDLAGYLKTWDSSQYIDTCRRSETRTAPKISETFEMSKSVPAESRGSRSRGSPTTSKTKKSDSKRHQAELEFALEKKKLEQEELRRKQEMPDIELALKLSKLEDEELCSEKSEISEMVSRPDMNKWVKGEHPWQDKLDGVSFSSAKKEEKISQRSTRKIFWKSQECP